MTCVFKTLCTLCACNVPPQYAPGGAGADAGAGSSAGKMREDLAARWNELKTPLADRVDCLSAMLDAAPASPEMVSRYEAVVEKLAARQPIVQVSRSGCPAVSHEVESFAATAAPFVKSR